jgi:hypothetical protein
MWRKSSFINRHASKTEWLLQIKVLIVEVKVNVIKQFESGEMKADVCWEFGLVKPTIQIMWKSGYEILTPEIGKIKEDLENQCWTK